MWLCSSRKTCPGSERPPSPVLLCGWTEPLTKTATMPKMTTTPATAAEACPAESPFPPSPSASQCGVRVFALSAEKKATTSFCDCFYAETPHLSRTSPLIFRPTLPPAKQANRNLILKAISEAQDSITKTTAYSASASAKRQIPLSAAAFSQWLCPPPTVPQRQTVPVAPRARLASNEEMTAAIQLVQEHLHSLAPQAQDYTAAEHAAAPRNTGSQSSAGSGQWDATRLLMIMFLMRLLQSDRWRRACSWRAATAAASRRSTVSPHAFVIKGCAPPSLIFHLWCRGGGRRQHGAKGLWHALLHREPTAAGPARRQDPAAVPALVTSHGPGQVLTRAGCSEPGCCQPTFFIWTKSKSMKQ